jgi:hypothetical protein
MTVWSDLTEDQQKDALSRVFKGENKYDIALSYGLKSSSFERKLRHLREIGEIDDYSQSNTGDCDSEIASSQSSFTEDGNEASLEWTSSGGPIRTLDRLIASHEIDLSIWNQYGPVTHNTWTTPRAKKDSPGFEFFQNHQVKAQFVKKNPVPIFPVISPVELRQSMYIPRAPRTSGIGTSFIIADGHFGFVKDLKTAKLSPFHNRRVLDACVQIIAKLQPDRVDILGDWLDMAEWTDRFMRDPEFYWTTQPALLEASWWLRRIREAAPDAQVAMHQGNHDKRMETALKTHLPAAYGLKSVDELDLPPALSIQKLLALHKLNIRWVDDYPDDHDWLNDGVSIEHGNTALSSGNTAKRVARDAHVTHVFGHIHRREMIDKTIRDFGEPRRVTAFCPGCVCWTDGRTPGSSKSSQWQNGAAIVEYEIGGTANAITPIFISPNGSSIFRGSHYNGHDNINALRESMDGWNV